LAKTIRVHLDDRKLQEIIRGTSEPVKRRAIADGVNYGIHQEFSTAAGGKPRKEGSGVTGKGHPSLVPAFENVTKDLPRAIGQAIERGVSLDNVIGKAAFDIQGLWAGDVNVDTGNYKNSIHVETE